MRVNKFVVFFLLALSFIGFYKVSFEKHSLVNNDQVVKEDISYSQFEEMSSDSVSVLQSSTGRLDGINDCYKSDSCNYNARDPREYSIEIGQDLRKELLSLLDRVETQELNGEAISEIGRKYIQNQDGHVKEAALLILTTQGPSKANLLSIVEHVIDFHNADLVEMALVELEKYELEEDRQYIYDALKKNLMTGSIISRERISRDIFSFISEETFHVYVEVAKSMPRGSIVRKNLEAALEKFEHRG